MAEASIRSFIAAPIAPPAREALTQLAASFEGAGDVRWCTPEQYHLTLKFLGNASARQLDRVAFTELHLTCNRFGKAQAETVAPLRELRSRSHVSTLNIHEQPSCVYESPTTRSQTKSEALTIRANRSSVGSKSLT